MRTLATIFVASMLLGAVIARPLGAETTPEVVLLGRSDLLAQNVPQRHVTRIERYVPPVPADGTNPALSALDDSQAPLLAAIPKPQTVWEPLVGPPRPSEPRQQLVGSLTPRQDPLIGEDLSTSMFETQQPLESILAAWAPIALLGMVVLTFRRWILSAVNRIVLFLVVAVHRPASRIDYASSGSDRRRRRSRHRAMDVSWYFRAAGSSRRRRRWSGSYRPREYVVTDVVYATAPAQQYLLTHSAS